MSGNDRVALAILPLPASSLGVGVQESTVTEWLAAVAREGVSRQWVILESFAARDPNLAVWCAWRRDSFNGEHCQTDGSATRSDLPELLLCWADPVEVTQWESAQSLLRADALVEPAECLLTDPGGCPDAALPRSCLGNSLWSEVPVWHLMPSAEGWHATGWQTLAVCQATITSPSGEGGADGCGPATRSLDRLPLDHARQPAPVRACRADWVLPVLNSLRELAAYRHQFEAHLQQAKLAALKELAYGASHEINNPLANISARAQTLLRGEREPQRRQVLATINTQAFRAHEMLADLMLFANPPQLEPVATDWAEFLHGVVHELQRAAPGGVQLEMKVERTSRSVVLDQAMMREVVRALWDNALQAMGGEGRLTFWGGWSIRQPQNGDVSAPALWAGFRLADAGCGLSAAARQHLFDPFYSGREAGRGLGFGLSKAWRIVEMHGGSVEAIPGELGGAEFQVWLPHGKTLSSRGSGK